jgi:hypothetical protein
MQNWQDQVWQEINAVPGVIPEGGTVLLIGGRLECKFPDTVRVVRRAWGDPLGNESGFDRAVILAEGNLWVDLPLLLTQLWKVVRADGMLVVIAARAAPWGVRNTAWQHGLRNSVWLRLLRESGWLVAENLTVGFASGIWARLLPWGGAVRLIIAQKRVGGTKLLVRNRRGGIELRPVGISV